MQRRRIAEEIIADGIISGQDRRINLGRGTVIKINQLMDTPHITTLVAITPLLGKCK
jgi:hypothetical protein